jgi:hypothetical protein
LAKLSILTVSVLSWNLTAITIEGCGTSEPGGEVAGENIAEVSATANSRGRSDERILQLQNQIKDIVCQVDQQAPGRPVRIIDEDGTPYDVGCTIMTDSQGRVDGVSVTVQSNGSNGDQIFGRCSFWFGEKTYNCTAIVTITAPLPGKAAATHDRLKNLLNKLVRIKLGGTPSVNETTSRREQTLKDGTVIMNQDWGGSPPDAIRSGRAR